MMMKLVLQGTMSALHTRGLLRRSAYEVSLNASLRSRNPDFDTRFGDRGWVLLWQLRS
jgi:hypothetical protein